RAYQQQHEQQAFTPAQAEQLVTKLLAARKQGHWEPSWFNAAGGTIEATAGVLELLSSLDPEKAQPLWRDALAALRGQLRLFGTWHNGAGTVALARALRNLPEPAQRDARLDIELNGKVLVTRRLDKRDPLG